MFDLKSTLGKLISEEIGKSLLDNGFTLKRKTDFVRNSDEIEQFVYVIFNKARGQEAGTIQVNIAFRHDKLEKKIAELKGAELRKGWPTASISTGYLSEECTYIDYYLDESTDIVDLGNQIVTQINKYAYAFWNKYSTLQGILDGYVQKDFALIAPLGNRYVWNLSAAYCLLGDTENAVKTLENWKEGRPSKDEIEEAINRIKAGLTETGE